MNKSRFLRKVVYDFIFKLTQRHSVDAVRVKVFEYLLDFVGIPQMTSECAPLIQTSS